MSAYQLTHDPDTIVRTVDKTTIPRGHRWWDEYEEWLAAGHVALPPPKPSIDERMRELTGAIDAWMDSTVRDNGYHSMDRCVSYAASAVDQWRLDAEAAIAWRDAVWVAAFQWRASVILNPAEELPTTAQVIALLPRPAAFGWTVHQHQ